MPASQFVVNYSVATGRIRAVYVFPEANENDSHLAAVKFGKGEAQVLLPMAQYADLNTLQSTLNKITGLTPDDAHDCFDAQGNFVCAVTCDLACGDGPPPGCAVMVPSVGGAPGGVLINGVYTPPISAAPLPPVGNANLSAI